VEAIVALAGNQDTWQRYSVAARQRARMFTWDRAGDKLIEVIRSVVLAPRLHVRASRLIEQ
jgi:glycosyltransferase involved in cell wall biosynthesis